VLVALGAFTRLDQFAVDRLMPELSADDTPSTLLQALLPIVGSDTLWNVAVDLWLYPASFPVSGLILIGCAWTLRRRGRAREGVLWVAAWLGGTAIEVLTKHALARPALFSRGAHVVDFDHALPSGHTLRSFLVAAALASTWRRGRWAFAWAASVWVLLVVQGWHTPTDVVGGLLLAGALALAVREGADAKRGGVDRGTLGAGRRHERQPAAGEAKV
jgi:membrane-associated phospholipid phosphatase